MYSFNMAFLSVSGGFRRSEERCGRTGSRHIGADH
jgi:hypothetical protein